MKRIIAGVASFLIAVALLEVVTRAAFSIVSDIDKERNSQEEWFIFSEELGWERKPGFDGRIGAVHRRLDGDGFLYGDSAKFYSPGKKILFLGDSNTFGNDSPADSAYPALVDSLLPEAVSINLATPGYSSYQGTIVLQKALKRFTPDLIIVSFNYNDRRYVLDHRNVDGPGGFTRLNDEANRLYIQSIINKIYTARAVRYLLRSVGAITPPPLLPARADTLIPRVPPQDYGKNLRAMARMAREKNIPIIFLLLRDGHHQTRFLREGLEALQRNEPQSAIELLRMQLYFGTEFGGIARLYLAKALRLIGDDRSADSVLVIKNPVRLLDGGQPILLDSEYNDVMRSVAKETGATLIDGAAVLDKVPSVYYDFCHFDARGHRMVAELVAATVSPFLKVSRR